jgi:hypothetical protein
MKKRPVNGGKWVGPSVLLIVEAQGAQMQETELGLG